MLIVLKIVIFVIVLIGTVTFRRWSDCKAGYLHLWAGLLQTSSLLEIKRSGNEVERVTVDAKNVPVGTVVYIQAVSSKC